jgi:hypothetical protein
MKIYSVLTSVIEVITNFTVCIFKGVIFYLYDLYIYLYKSIDKDYGSLETKLGNLKNKVKQVGEGEERRKLLFEIMEIQGILTEKEEMDKLVKKVRHM